MDAYRKNSSDQATVGYRPLPNAAPSRGPEPRTMVFAVVGVALGIVAGTLLADGSWQTSYQKAMQHPVQASAMAAGSAKTAAAKAPEAPLSGPRGVAQGAPQSASAVQPGEAKTLAAKPGPTVVKASAGGERRPALKLAAAHGRLARFKHHGRHRRHVSLKAAVTRLAPARMDAPKHEENVDSFTFTVEGSLTEASYDSFSGMVQTYEGETFALDQAARDTSTIAWGDFPADFQYRCDQAGHCTLFRGGSVIQNVQRTR